MYEFDGALRIATQDTIDFWEARDCCWCNEILSPVQTIENVHHYECACGMSWTRKA